MKVSETRLPGVLLVEPKLFGDDRGFFSETFHQKRYADAGIPGPFVQDNLSRSVQLARTKQSLRHRWHGIRIVGVHASGNGHFKVGDAMQVEAMIDLPGVDPKDVSVQLYCGPISAKGEIEQPKALLMQHAKSLAQDRHVFVGKIDCRTSGRQGYAIRIVPGTPDLATPFEPGLIIWN